ncbi:MAG TPA: GNAT family N-acetyltransferase [Clostridia bacterium]|nr:GNAT family N-acetyltransferase [Clostridia bacterium]
MLIKKLSAEEYPRALSLVWSVFLQYEAPDYPTQELKTFKSSITDVEYLDALKMWGAYSAGRLVGVIALRNGGGHIALFFVDGTYHRRGIGRALFETALANSAGDIITVNSSPYAIEIYRRLGFMPNGPEQNTQGIRYTPMIYAKN